MADVRRRRDRRPVVEDLTPNDLAVIRRALETQERVMLDRGAHPAAEAAAAVRTKVARLSGGAR